MVYHKSGGSARCFDSVFPATDQVSAHRPYTGKYVGIIIVPADEYGIRNYSFSRGWDVCYPVFRGVAAVLYKRYCFSAIIRQIRPGVGRGLPGARAAQPSTYSSRTRRRKLTLKQKTPPKLTHRQTRVS